MQKAHPGQKSIHQINNNYYRLLLPTGMKMSWSRVIQEHGIMASNGGQIVKQFARFPSTIFDNRKGEQGYV